MSNPVVSESIQRFYQLSEECVQSVVTELFREHGPSFTFVPVRPPYTITCDTGGGPFTAVITKVIGSDETFDFLGHPEYCEYDSSEWSLDDIFSAEDRLNLLSSLFDPGQWKRNP